MRFRPGYVTPAGATLEPVNIGVNGDKDPLLGGTRTSEGRGWAHAIMLIIISFAVLAALILGVVAVLQRHDTELKSSVSPSDTLTLGDDEFPFQRHEAGCAVTTRISEADIPDSPGLETLRHVIFDGAACAAGGFDHAPPFAGFGCRNIVIPPPIGNTLPCNGCGSGCPFGTITFGTIYSTGGAVVPSDERVKEQVIDYPPEEALATLMRLRPKQYYHTEEYAATFDSPHRYHRHGFISQDVEDVLPGAVRTFGEYKVGETVYQDFKLLNKDDLMVESVGAIQALNKQVATLHDRLERLEAALAALTT